MILYNKKVIKAQQGIKTLEVAKTAAQKGGRDNKDNYRYDILSGGYTYLGDDYVKPHTMGGAGALALVGPGMLNGISRIVPFVRGERMLATGVKALPSSVKAISAGKRMLPAVVDRLPAAYKIPTSYRIPGGPGGNGAGKYLGALLGGIGSLLGLKYLDSRVPETTNTNIPGGATRDSANATSVVHSPIQPLPTNTAVNESLPTNIKVNTPASKTESKTKKEDTKATIERIQIRMNARRKDRGQKPLATDGIWGKNTQAEYEATTKEQQTLHDAGYNVAVDGIWGDKSQAGFDKKVAYDKEYKKAGEDLKKLHEMNDKIKNRAYEKGGILYMNYKS